MKWGISRTEQDQFALGSHQKALAAQRENRFKSELVSVELPQKKGLAIQFEADEGPRADTSLDKLSRLRTIFRDGGTVTAGNSSPLNDGVSAVLLMSERAAKEFGKKSLARFASSADAGVDPRLMGIGPVPASRKALERIGWSVKQLDLVELNEAFASQSLACIRDLGLDPSKVNVNGGAIALGHPLGSSGARIVTTLVHEMNRRDAKQGLATMCIGVGQGIALAVQRG